MSADPKLTDNSASQPISRQDRPEEVERDALRRRLLEIIKQREYLRSVKPR